MRSLKFRRVGFGLALLGLVGAITLVSATRGRLVHRFVIEALRTRGVPAHATIEAIGADGVVARNVTLGDPAHPDLTASRASLALGWTGLLPHLTAVRLVRPILHARIDAGGRITLGTLDHLRAPPDGTPGRLPDLDLAIDEGRLIIATPYGPLAASLSGDGNPAHSFTGHLRLAPATLTIARCRVPLTSGDLALGARARTGTVAGALDLGALDCHGLAAASARVALALAIPDPLTHAQGRIELALALPAMAAVRANRATATFDGSVGPTHVLGDVRANAQHLAYHEWAAAAAAIAGHLDFSPSQAPPVVAGRATLQHAALAWPSRARLAQPTPGLAATPLGPLEAAARAALARAASDFDVFANVSLNRRPNTLYNKIEVRAGSGAQATYRQGVDVTSITVTGGGLPTAHIALSAAPTLFGRANVAAFETRSAHLAAAEIAFARTGDRITIAGPLLLDGPLGPGRVEGLAIPAADFRITLAPAIKLTPARCLAVTARRLIEPRYTLTNAITTLCPAAGPTLAIAPNGKLSGHFTAPALSADGIFGTTPFAIATGPIAVALSGTDAAAIVTASAAPLHLTAYLHSGPRPMDVAHLTATARQTAAGWSFVGHMKDGALPGLPVAVTALAGDWALTTADTLTLVHGIGRIVDPLSRPRFAPLAMGDLALAYANGVASGCATLALGATNATVATLTGRYRLADSTGTLDMTSALTFAPQLQPYQISARARGVIENVAGGATASAHLAYRAGQIGGDATLALDHLSFATAALGPVTAVTGTLRLPRLPTVVSAPAEFTIGAINPGVLVEHGTARIQLLAPTQIRIDRLAFPFAGGTLRLNPITLDTDVPERRFTLAAQGLDFAQFLQRLDFKNLDATGTFDGVLPLILTDKGGRIAHGHLEARAPGGRIRYVGALGPNLPAAANLAFDALKSMRYRSLTIGIDGDLDGDLVTDIRFTGENEAAIATGKRLPKLGPGVPFRFGVTVRAPFRRLLGTASSLEDVTPLIQQAQPSPLTPPSPPKAH